MWIVHFDWKSLLPSRHHVQIHHLFPNLPLTHHRQPIINSTVPLNSRKKLKFYVEWHADKQSCLAHQNSSKKCINYFQGSSVKS